MKLVTRVCAVLGVLALAACTGASSSSTVDALNKAQAVGSPFTKMLAGEYRDYANYLQTKTLDYADAIHFARKGLAAASGVIVMPETLDDWDLSDKNLSEMNPARALLVDALEDGGRELASDKAAVAQARFDCWAEQQEENWTKDVPCKSQFFAALKALQAAIAVKPAPAAPAEEFPAPVTEMAKGPAVPVQEAMFIVFFDWSKFNISAGANDVLDAVAQEVKSRKDVKGLVIVGHTDSSGSTRFNQKLSMKRANAVKAGLVSRGVPADMIRVEGRGEDDLLVKTKDNVREPANRRAQITLE
jgi:OOP family OmpA-OmpF porin